VIEDVASIIGLNHREMTIRHLLSETVESGRDVRMHLNVDPARDVFLGWDLPDDELLPEILVVDHVRRVANNMFDLDVEPSMVSGDSYLKREGHLQLLYRRGCADSA
jgi:hypothetical protein